MIDSDAKTDCGVGKELYRARCCASLQGIQRNQAWLSSRLSPPCSRRAERDDDAADMRGPAGSKRKRERGSARPRATRWAGARGKKRGRVGCAAWADFGRDGATA